ncbi:MAG: hypothetical protein GC152_04260 [Alphaproteobacteria bacterium]|nr:hypothetical protein [Alphaproteobacteria bacterium]
MILRRLSQHVKDQNWFAVALDFLIVVVGVFMGLQVQEWNAARKDRIEAVFILDRLEEDFTRIHARADRSLAAHATSLMATARLIHGISNEALEKESLASDISLAASGGTPPGPSTTFQELKSDGRIDLIKDFELRRALSEYDDYATLVRQEFRLFERPLTALGEKLMAVRTLEATGLPSHSFDSLGATKSVNEELVLSDPALLPLLQTAYLTHDNAHVVYSGMQADVEEILTLIRNEKEAAK